MSADIPDCTRFFLHGDDGDIRAVFAFDRQESTANATKLNRKRKAEVSEAELIAQHDSPQQSIVPNLQEMQDQNQVNAQEAAQREDQHKAQSAQPQPEESSVGETQASNPGFLRRMRNHIATAYNSIDRSMVASGFRHVYDRVTRTFTRRPVPVPRYEVEEVHSVNNNVLTVKRIHRSNPNAPTVKRFKRLPHNIRDRNTDGHNTLRPEAIPYLERFVWTDDVTRYIGEGALLQVFAFLNETLQDLVNWRERLKSWFDDEHQHAMTIDQVPKEEFPSHNIPFSIIVHNYMIANFAAACEDNMLIVAEGWTRLLRETMDMISTIYSQANLQELRDANILGLPTERFKPFRRTGVNKAYFRHCAEFLGYIVEQREAMHLSRSDALSLAQIAMDFDAYHKEEIPVSYIDWKVIDMPGVFPSIVEDLLFDYISLDELKFDFLDANQSRIRPRDTDAVMADRNAQARNSRRAPTRVAFVSPVAYYMSPARTPRFRGNPENTDPSTPDSPETPESPETPPRTKLVFHGSPEDEKDVTEPLPVAQESITVEKQAAWNIRMAMLDEPSELEKLFDTTLQISEAKKEEHALRLQERKDREEEERRKVEEAEKAHLEKVRQQEEARQASRRVLRPPKHSIIPSLTHEWDMKVTQTLSAGENTELAKSPEGSGLKRRDFRTVVPPTEWLNDEIVNSGLIHVANYINKQAGINNTKTQTAKCMVFNSFFGAKLAKNGAEGSARQMKRSGVRKDNFLDIETILVPICRDNHWTLVVVRPQKRTITHMDSLKRNGAGSPDITSNTLKWIRDILQDSFVSDEWDIVNHISPAQVNGWDCGVHAVTNGMCLALGVDPTHYKSDELPLQRRRIAAVILNGGFTGDFELAL
ncbi:putative ulp1 protease family protein [Phaeoacremonium minimum UCRPA7]|uniref:Putative ulp1 protease family protein n=1 Tax=Phaeoacremonium minimum (strain UCR-PA7) TaxID=1286976 RepID=R8BY21_PHAM7|nr:putative ulp1 protease family protein [Phaeoacremonium minimum UCRPA7]EOO04296.1 putative ulp1 protease family protein [Phaeoacremonium minimum UCRPA7]